MSDEGIVPAPIYYSHLPASPATGAVQLPQVLMWELVMADLPRILPDADAPEDKSADMDEDSPTDRLLSVAEVAELLDVSAATVYGLCSRRKLRHERHGLGRGTIRIPRDAVEEYRRGVTVGTGAVPPPSPSPPKLKLKHLQL